MNHPYAAVFFDLDDTLIEGYMGEHGKPRHHYARVVALPRRLERLALLRQAGVKIGIASNQAGVGLGFITEGQANQKRLDALADFDLWGRDAPMIMCYYHKDSTDPRYNDPRLAYRRKPEPGMLIELAAHFLINPTFCLFVGDRPEDQLAAGAAGMDFCHADLFFSTEAIRPINDWPIPMREDRPAGKWLIWTCTPEAKTMGAMRNDNRHLMLYGDGPLRSQAPDISGESRAQALADFTADQLGASTIPPADISPPESWDAIRPSKQLPDPGGFLPADIDD